jgi:hypothetical protein
MATKYTFRENVLRIVAVIGLIAVLLLGAWGIIQLAFYIPEFFSNLGNGGGTSPSTIESLTVAVPGSVKADQPFPISWNHQNGSGQYSYSLSYSCADGLSAKAPLPTGAAQVVACNTPFNYINATTTSPLIFTLSGTKATTVTIKVSATKLSSGAATVSSTAQTVVNPATSTATKPTTTKPASKPTATKPSTSKPASSYVPSGRTSNLYGLPDLQVRITSNPGSLRVGAPVALQFVVENVGTNVSPQNWSFTAELPYSPTYTFQSQGQQALYPGDKIVYTLSYTAAAPYQQHPYADNPYGTQYSDSVWLNPCSTMSCGQYNPYTYGQASTASISIDPYNLVAESNESNNYAAVSYQVY